MADTDLSGLQDQIEKFWSPRLAQELREATLLPALVSKDYDGEIKEGGDQVTVTQLVAPQGELKTINTGVDDGDANDFTPEQLIAKEIKIVANKRAVAAHRFTSISQIQSLIDKDNPEVMNGMKFAIERQMNAYLYSLFAPQVANKTGSVSAFGSNHLKSARVAAGKGRWMRNKEWIYLLDPTYHGDMLDDSKLASSDYVGGDAPMINGFYASKRMNFNLIEDNSLADKKGYYFHPDAIHLVMQTSLQVKISDLHVLNKFGYLMSVDIIFGAKQGFDHDKLCGLVQGTAL